MKQRQIRIDWDDLEAAFDNKNEEIVYYLDTVTGHVHLEGEGEVDEFDDEDDNSPRPPTGSHTDATRLPVPAADPAEETRWMWEFVEAQELDDELDGRLVEALDTEAPAVAFREVIQEHEEARDRWFLYRSERLHERMQAWLDEHEVHLAEPPPWVE